MLKSNCAAEAVPPPREVPPGRGTLKVLVADDDETSRNTLAEVVRSLGCSCRVAADGLEAWHIFEEDPAHLILSDWKMPRLSGVDLCRRAREAGREGTSYTHFVLVTALDSKESFLEGMRAGADDYLVKPVDFDELDARLHATLRVAAVHEELVVKTRALERDSQRLAAVARTDPLTEVANRLRLREDLQALGDRALRYGHRYCAALCDIDWFKSYNDGFGHLAGDHAIRVASHAIQEQLRRGDGFYRYGGDEFLVLLPEQSLSAAAECMERVRRAVASLPDLTQRGTLARPITISVGIADFRSAPLGTDAIQAWLHRADRALYRAKARGRNCVEVDS